MSIKKILFFAILVISLLVINSLIHSIVTLWQKNHLIVSAQRDLEKQKRENSELKKRLTEVKKPEFVEEEARDKLFMAKSGEKIVIISQDSLVASSSSPAKENDLRPNWQKWWETFF